MQASPCMPARTRDLCSQDLAFGVCAAPGESTRFKSEGKPPPLATVSLLDSATGFDPKAGGAGSVEDLLKRGAAYARATLYARYLVESPPNVCTPSYLAGAARAVAESNSEAWKISVLEREECERMGMGCYLGVAQVFFDLCHTLCHYMLTWHCTRVLADLCLEAVACR